MKTLCLRWLQTPFQIALLAAIWLLADIAVRTLHLPLPANLTGMLLLLVCILLGVVKAQWFSAGARWLLAEMLLFFVPAVVAVVNYQELLLQEGWRIMVVLVVSTVLVLGTTALVVDRVYRLELRLARRSRRHV
ncbi:MULTISPECIES: CidA/LrgA family protein [Aeromonas]|uniref:Murein hydrolase exporter n=1 Tax=Aeromonas caviae TaxID=648 RepID=A0AA37FTF2_AERCA|nr:MULTISPECIES: CidA/LrgA family protein [Aeromonas]MDU7779700.1 CidA/LrgA family protein [Aeromonas caviae]MEB6606969.1 CidA/LrgA family protein [Aeromonas sanarellii]WOX48965.1 CidA/LrgA family protein [Aeromonas sp. XH]GJA18626.1 murein hydrolase exporter [Aeromonas caviae]GJA26120.1 murein hydrolase exporter [Aeromonas caviae]